MTETPILDESAIAEIESRHARVNSRFEELVILTPAERNVLCATVRHLCKVAEAARDFIWEPENWEAYQDSKESNSAAWPPEFLLLAQAVEEKYGPMPIDGGEVNSNE